MVEMPVTLNQLLIALVRERRPLWDSRDPLYRDRIVKGNLWQEVSDIMRKNEWDFSDEDLRTKWRHLRDRYTKCVRDDNGPNFQVIGKKSPWSMLPHLEFLRETVTHRSKCESNKIKHISTEMIQSPSLLLSLQQQDPDSEAYYNASEAEYEAIDDKTALRLSDGAFMNVHSPENNGTIIEVGSGDFNNVHCANSVIQKPSSSYKSNKRDHEDDLDRSFFKYLKEHRLEDSTPEDLFFQSVAKESQQLNHLRRAKLKLKVQEYLVELLEEEEHNK